MEVVHEGPIWPTDYYNPNIDNWIAYPFQTSTSTVGVTVEVGNG